MGIGFGVLRPAAQQLAPRWRQASATCFCARCALYLLLRLHLNLLLRLANLALPYLGPPALESPCFPIAQTLSLPLPAAPHRGVFRGADVTVHVTARSSLGRSMYRES